MKDKKIVVLPSGWVFAGEWNEEEGGKVVLTDAVCIRVWGTTAGLGQLALFGPQAKTILDPCGVVRFLLSEMIAALDCVPGKGW